MAEPGGSIDSVLVHAARLTAEGRPESAIAVLRPALELHPDHSVAWCRLAAAQLDAGAWRRGNANLRARAEMTDSIDVLGARYVTFMATIERERRIVEEEAVTAHDNVREVIRLYAPFIAEFGEPVQARRLERT